MARSITKIALEHSEAFNASVKSIDPPDQAASSSIRGLDMVFADPPPTLVLDSGGLLPSAGTWLSNLDSILLSPESSTAVNHESRNLVAGGTSCEHTEQLATVQAKLISRTTIRHFFVSYLSAGTDVMRRMARDLFDRHGVLQPELKNHEFRRGSGIWGDELSEGDILLIESLNVDMDMKYRDSGRAITSLLMAEARKRSDHFVIVTCIDHTFDSTVTRTVAGDQRDKDMRTFVRTSGFRRIGNTPWFGFKNDIGQNPNKILQPGNDFDPPPNGFTISSLELNFCLGFLHDENQALDVMSQYWEHLPLHIYPWLTVDDDRRTLMHLAAINTKPKVLSWLLTKVPDLVHMRDKSGHTPLEALRHSLEIKRTFYPDYHNIWSSAVQPDDFSGYNDGQVECLVALTMASGEKLDEGTTSIDRLRYGCTCGLCIDGYISPRMNVMIQYWAIRRQWAVSKQAEAFDKNNPDESYYFNAALPTSVMANVLPDHVRQAFTMSVQVRRGFASLFGSLYITLRAGLAPTDEALLAVVESSGPDAHITKQYLKAGGDFHSVRRLVLAAAMSSVDWTSMTVRDSRELGLPDLPACRNDFEFTFVDRLASAGSTTAFMSPQWNFPSSP